ncbi:MAG: T9SS type A sorting domain-containing protein [Chitinophagales bacterium]|nr:T9SS type A sorting domain-containing protein [Chitinophagales bacterium]
MSKKLTLTIVTHLLLPLSLCAQSIWDGGAGTTNWQDANNWDPDGVPAAGALVQIGTDVMLTGTVPNIPAQVRITSGATVTLGLDVTIGDGTTTEHGLRINANGTLNIASGKTLTINVATSNNGVQMPYASNNARLNIKAGADLVIQQAFHGINLGSSSADILNEGDVDISNANSDAIRMTDGDFTNDGTLTITGADSDGIENDGNFINNGTIEIEDADRYGIYNNAGGVFMNKSTLEITNPGAVTNDGIYSINTFENTSTGTITISKPFDDCIAQIESTFTNNGIINLTVKNFPSSTNNGLVVGTASDAATFINSSSGTINIDGGSTAIGRGMYVYEMGTFNNFGQMTFTNGSNSARLYSRGTSVNELGGTLDMTNGRVNVNMGTFDNHGLIKSIRGTPGVFNDATATNNGFFNYAGTGSFANGSGTTTDNGIDLNDVAQTTIDAGGSCTVDIAEASYEYFDGGNSVGSTDASGSITFSGVLSSDPVSLTNGLSGVTITIENVCVLALLPIELIYFDAKLKGDIVNLEWQTATEVNNDYIAVERSSDGLSFTEIGRREGAINSTQAITYRLTDRQPHNGHNFYRLRQVDLDGTVYYSEIVSVFYTSKNLRLIANPSLLSRDTELKLELSNFPEEEMVIELVDIQGRSMKKISLTGGQHHAVDISGLSSGLYLLKGTGKYAYLTTKIMII